MKRYGILALAAVICLAFAMPASAKMTLQGNIGYELTYSLADLRNTKRTIDEGEELDLSPKLDKTGVQWSWDSDDGLFTTFINLGIDKVEKVTYKGGTGRTGDTGLNVAQTSNLAGAKDITQVFNPSFGATYKAKNYGGNFTFSGKWTLGSTLNKNTSNQINPATYSVNTYGQQALANPEGVDIKLDEASLWWQATNINKLIIGKFVGPIGGSKALVKEFGDFNTDKSVQLEVDTKLPWGTLKVSFLDPKSVGTILVSGSRTWSGTAWTDTRKYYTGFPKEGERLLPPVIASFDAKVFNFNVTPGIYYEKRSWERNPFVNAATLPLNSEEEFSAWVVSLPLKGQIGPVSVEAEYNFGKNTGNLNVKDSGSKIATVTPYYTAAGPMKFDDTDWTGWWVSGSMKLGIGKLYGAISMDETDKLSVSAATGLSNNNRVTTEDKAYWLGYEIPVAKSLYITPEVQVKDSADTYNSSTGAKAGDSGMTKVLAVKFNLRF